MSNNTQILICFLFSNLVYFLAQSAFRPVLTLKRWLVAMIVSSFPLYGLLISLFGFAFVLNTPSGSDLFYVIWCLSLLQYAVASILFCLPLAFEYFDFDLFDFDLRKKFYTADFKRYRFSLLKCLKLFALPKVKPETYSEVIAKDGAKLPLQIWRNSNPKAPVVIQIFGGGYTIGSTDQLPRVNDFFVECGYHVIALDYRLMPKFRWPTPRQDIQDGWNYVLQHFSELKIDPDFFVFAGRSAGGHLALDAVSQIKDSRIRGVINLYAPVDWLEVEALSHKGDILESSKAVPFFFGGSFEKTREIREDASPIHNLTAQHPKVLNLYGQRDCIVPFTEGKIFHAACEKIGVPSFNLSLRFATHVFDYNLNSPSGQRSAYAIRHFLTHLNETKN